LAIFLYILSVSALAKCDYKNSLAAGKSRRFYLIGTIFFTALWMRKFPIKLAAEKLTMKSTHSH
jgi:hypothetical protein